jgi:hypothetical protein
VDLYWLFNGKGVFPNDEKKKTVTIEKSAAQPPLQEKLNEEIAQDKTIERIVIFYSDGSFKNFQN